MYRKDTPQAIQSMFNSIAYRYDLTNTVLSLSLHKRWNRALIRHVQSQHSSHSPVLVDLCSGTGDIVCDYLRHTQSSCHAYLIDFSSEMLECAKSKTTSYTAQHQLFYIEADVQQLPLPSQIADYVTMAYGIRNVQEPARCIEESLRILKPGGCLGILELTRPHSRILRFGHQFYLRTFMPLLGKWLTHNKQAYQYLRESIQTFVAPQELEQLLKAKGFIQTKRYALTGGIATILIGHKPV